jgi:hypothetical protein
LIHPRSEPTDRPRTDRPTDDRPTDRPTAGPTHVVFVDPMLLAGGLQPLGEGRSFEGATI